MKMLLPNLHFVVPLCVATTLLFRKVKVLDSFAKATSFVPEQNIVRIFLRTSYAFSISVAESERVTVSHTHGTMKFLHNQDLTVYAHRDTTGDRIHELN